MAGLRIEEVDEARYAAMDPGRHNIFFSPVFLRSNLHKADGLRYLLLRQGDYPLAAWPVGVKEGRGTLAFSASFSVLAPPLWRIRAAAELADCLAGWAGGSGLASLELVLPPRFYGPWVSLLGFMFRRAGFVSTRLQLELYLEMEEIRVRRGWSQNRRRDEKSLAKLGLDARESKEPDQVLAWMASYYRSRGREMSVNPEQLGQYMRAGLPVRVLEVHRNQQLIFTALFYDFNEVTLYMFSAIAEGVSESPFTWLLAQVPYLAGWEGTRFLDLGQSGDTAAEDRFLTSGVVSFKEQFQPRYDCRETLSLALRP